MRSKVDCGIYRFVNTKNNKQYIGSAMDVYDRKNSHIGLLRRGKHHSLHFQHAWNKWGEESFVWEILEECDPEDLIIREQFYFDKENQNIIFVKMLEILLVLKDQKKQK